MFVVAMELQFSGFVQYCANQSLNSYITVELYKSKGILLNSTKWERGLRASDHHYCLLSVRSLLFLFAIGDSIGANTGKRR